MALAALIKKEVFENLSEELKKEYKEHENGMYILDVTPVNDFALENVKGLKSSLAKERTGREDAERQAKASDEKAKEALKKLEKLADGKSDEKVKEQIEAIKKQLEEKHKGELGAKEESVQMLTKQLEKVMVEAEAIKAIAEHKGSTTLLLPHVKASTRMRQTDKGEFIVEVLGDDGNARISPAAGSTAPMTIAELVAEMKGNDTFAAAFEGSGATGSGSGNNDYSQNNKNKKVLEIKASDQEAIDKHVDDIASGKAVVVDD